MPPMVISEPGLQKAEHPCSTLENWTVALHAVLDPSFPFPSGRHQIQDGSDIFHDSGYSNTLCATGTQVFQSIWLKQRLFLVEGSFFLYSPRQRFTDTASDMSTLALNEG